MILRPPRYTRPDTLFPDTTLVQSLDLIDASALLWRLQLTGQDVGDRWLELSEAWDRHADGRLYAFNDWHAVMAHLGGGRGREVERILASLRSAAVDGRENARWARHYELGRAACRERVCQSV